MTIKRQKMALALDTLIAGVRMHYPWEAELVQNLFYAINKHWPKAVWGIDQKIGIKAIQTTYAYMHVLAHIALHKDFPLQGYEQIIRPKVETTYMQSLFIKEPDLLNTLIEQIKKRPLPEPLLQKIADIESIKSKPIEQIRELIDENLADTTSRKKEADKLLKNKAQLVKLYSMQYSFEAITKFFDSALEILTALDYKLIANQWNNRHPLEEGGGFDLLEKDIVEHFAGQSKPDPEYNFRLLWAILGRYQKLGFLASMDVMMEIYFNELARTIKSPNTISEGLTFDLDYSTALFHADIFFSYDSKLSSTVKSLAKKGVTGRKSKFAVASSVSEFKRHINKLTNA